MTSASDDSIRGTTGPGQGDRIYTSALLANDGPGLQITGLVGATMISATDFLLSTYDPDTGAIDALVTFNSLFNEIRYSGYDSQFSFAYEAVDGGGNVHTATVTVTVDNRPPVATSQTLFLVPGPNTFFWADILGSAATPTETPSSSPATTPSRSILPSEHSLPRLTASRSRLS